VIMERPPNERCFLLLVVGYPSEGATVPDIGRKSLDQFTSHL
jgi:iodotyrosine deiodinase